MQSLVEQLPGTDIDENLGERQRKVDLWAKILGTGVISLFVLAVLSFTIYQLFVLQDDVIRTGSYGFDLGISGFLPPPGLSGISTQSIHADIAPTGIIFSAAGDGKAPARTLLGTNTKRDGPNYRTVNE